MDTTFRHRCLALAVLEGDGCEVGAMNHPAPVPSACRMEYVDIMDRAALLDEFPEVPPEAVHAPGFVGDISAAALPAITGRIYDFVVCLHVLEHVANPVQALANLLAGVRDGGLLALAIPDRDRSFDRDRAETPWEHLRAEYRASIREASDEHYADFVRHVHPAETATPERFRAAVAQARRHLEHVHVWTSAGFVAFLHQALGITRARAWPLITLDATATGFECFCLLQKEQVPDMAAMARRWLAAVWEGRADLRAAFDAPNVPAFVAWAKGVSADTDSDGPFVSRAAVWL